MKHKTTLFYTTLVQGLFSHFENFKSFKQITYINTLIERHCVYRSLAIFLGKNTYLYVLMKHLFESEEKTEVVWNLKKRLCTIWSILAGHFKYTSPVFVMSDSGKNKRKKGNHTTLYSLYLCSSRRTSEYHDLHICIEHMYVFVNLKLPYSM